MAATETSVSAPPEPNAATQLQELLGGSHSTPVWLNPERFLLAEFDSENVVLDLRRYVPLATLHNELNDYLALLKAKLVEVINEDYSDYVSLSSRLVNVDGSVLRMRKPLLELKDKLGVVQDAVKAELTALNQGLRRRKEVATARSLLELLQELAHVASKVEKLLAEVAAADGGGTSDLDSHSRLLERVAGEVSRLIFQANRGKDLAFVRAMEPRVAAYRAQLEGYLAAALQLALGQRHTSAALHCLHGYVELGEAGPAEGAVRRVVVAPIVSRLVAAHKQHHARPAPGSREGEALSSLLSSILAAVQQECGPLLQASLAPQGALRIFDFLGNSILEEVQNVLASEMPGIFSPGVPPAFHANFLSAMKFLSDLEACCQGRTALERLRASAAYAAFLRRWNLSVYFSLLYQEIAGELEDSMAMSKLELLEPPHPQGLCLPVTAALQRCLQRACSPDVFLLQLSDRFMRLVLQLLQRYRTWMEQGLAARSAAQQQQQQPPAAGAPPPAAAATTAGVAAGSSEGGAGPGSPASWVAQLPVEDLGLLLQDLQLASQLLLHTVLPGLEALLAPLPGDVLGAVRLGLQAAAAGLQQQAGCFLSCMAAEVGERCVAVVKQLKGITATYRMTTKGPPTRHSHYVTGVLAPLRAVLESERLKQLPREAAGQLTAAVAELVSGRYQLLADELLTTVRKTVESLKRLKKATAEGAGDGMSDSDKIGLQLYLDVQEYGHQLMQFGLVLADVPAYQKLLESVSAYKMQPAK